MSNYTPGQVARCARAWYDSDIAHWPGLTAPDYASRQATYEQGAARLLDAWTGILGPSAEGQHEWLITVKTPLGALDACATVRADDLRAALAKAVALPLNHWFDDVEDDDEEEGA